MPSVPLAVIERPATCGLSFPRREGEGAGRAQVVRSAGRGASAGNTCLTAAPSGSVSCFPPRKLREEQS